MRRWLTATLMLALLPSCGLFAAPGTPCQKHEQCGGLKDGYCAKAEICTAECSNSIPCPEGSTCYFGGRNICLPNCEKDEDCLPNFRCADEKVCRVKSALEPPAM